jgi:acetyltransferase
MNFGAHPAQQSVCETDTGATGSSRRALDAIFSPRSVAVIGASERQGSVGRSVLFNLLSNPFGGAVFPVNLKRKNVLGIRAYPRVDAVPEHVDLAIIIAPAKQVPEVISECIAAGVCAGIVISAGFREVGEEGLALERDIKRRLAGSKMRILGPNCLGVMNPISGLNAMWAPKIARSGNVAFLSQSGALSSAVLDWSLREMVGFSSFVSVGSMLDISWGDLIDYFGDDPRTNAIVMYMESVGDARHFLSAAREVTLTKPIIVIKGGVSETAAEAATSHTGTLAESDEVLRAAFRRVGVLRVNSVADLFYMAEVLAKQPRPRGPNLCIVTNAGGPGVLATDALLATSGQLAKLTPETIAHLNEFLPQYWSHRNPIDIFGDADPQRYAKTFDTIAKDPNCDGILVILAPQGSTSPTETAELLKPYAKSTGKPVLASFMGGAEVREGTEILVRAGIPVFPFPDTAARAFNYMWKYTYNLRGLYETPALPVDAEHASDQAAVEGIVQNARSAGRKLLTECESKQILAAYNIPAVETHLAHTQDEAVAAAEVLGFPVVLKLYSETVTHKTDVGGVQLNLQNAESVRKAFGQIEQSVDTKLGKGHFLGVTVQPMIVMNNSHELIIGSSLDPQFGPVLLFGAGGQMVEVLEDRSLALPPLNTTLARRMMEQTRVWKALKGVRGMSPIDIAALEALLVRFSQLVVEQPWIAEIDINPLLVSPEGILALDARVVIHGPEVAEKDLQRTAVRPYPSQYVAPWVTKTGAEVLIRPIRPEDEPMLIKFHERLSDRSVYLRYFQPLKLSQRTSHERLTRICFIDYDREIALVVERKGPDGPEILAVGRLSKIHGADEAECAAVTLDACHHQGIGSELFRRLIAVAREEKIGLLVATMLAENREMRAICKKLGFAVHLDMEDQTVRAELRPLVAQ